MFSYLSAVLWATSFVYANPVDIASTAACPADNSADYDYIIVGAGVGGGPLAARLALNNFKVLLIDAGEDQTSYNFTVPIYNNKASDDPATTLGYEVQLYAPGSKYGNVTNWYPRAAAIGGSAFHNALLNADQSGWDFDNLANITGDRSFAYKNVRPYFDLVERNLWLPKDVANATGHSTTGWLGVDVVPNDIIVEPEWHDQQLIDLVNGATASIPSFYPNYDINSPAVNGIPGGGWLTFTKDESHKRSSVRDHIIATHNALPTRLNLRTNTMVTKVLTCTASKNDKTGAGLRAYGVQVASGAGLIPVAERFTGKQMKLGLDTITAKYEVIVSAGVFQTPQLLMLSGIGDSAQLKSHGIDTLVHSPGVGSNLQDRLEITVNWNLQRDHLFFKGCTFNDDPAQDPCLDYWLKSNHTGPYAQSSGIIADVKKSIPSKPYLDLWTHWVPAHFIGYYKGYSKDIIKNFRDWSFIILHAHTSSRGWVRLTGNHPQDKLEINKNLYANAASRQELINVREQIKHGRAVVANMTLMNEHILNENWPGSNVTTDAQIDDFIVKNAWGHHACCTAAIGRDGDPNAVLDGRFNVRGVHRLRVIDIASWPEIPGMFLTTPAYVLSEKGAGLVLADAQSRGWTPTK